ncbi:hypothetical protein KCP69_22410 [Salmonella enterica subsp. enterica]|nr:hypothetical protein KCP69_22410 [Salmonella enterica subsp. enterica]
MRSEVMDGASAFQKRRSKKIILTLGLNIAIGRRGRPSCWGSLRRLSFRRIVG